MRTKKARLFRDMDLDEIEEREKKANSIILFDEGCADIIGIEFQKSRFEENGEPVLCILIDGVKRHLSLYGEQLENLKNFLNTQFE
jgi:hypothetical protein